MRNIGASLAGAVVLVVFLPASTTAGQMSFQTLKEDALSTLSRLYETSSTSQQPSACSSHHFNWEPGGFLIRCSSPGTEGQEHYWLATAVKGETLGLTPLSSNAIAFSPEPGTSLSQDAKYPVREIVNIPLEDQQAAYTQARQAFEDSIQIEE